MLAVDVAQVWRQFSKQRHRHRAIAEKRARFASSQNLALDQQFAVFHRHPGVLQQRPASGLLGRFEDGRNPGAIRIGTDHVGRGAAS
jgi:hypothetical protein